MTSCVLVIERDRAPPIVIAYDSFYSLSKFKDKLDSRITGTRVKATHIVGLMALEDFMSIEQILKESPQELPPSPIRGNPP